MRRALVAMLGLVALLGLDACSLWGMEGGPGAAGAAEPSDTVAATDAVAGADGVQRATITMGDDLRLHPSLVRAHAGTVELTFRNTGSTPHDIEVQLPAGESGTGNLNGGAATVVRISVSQPGTYPFPCLYHQSSGMQGTLEVIP
jgi:plastocyanin